MLDTGAMQAQLTQDAVANRLRAIREHMHMERTPFAEWLGVPRTRYANWESAKNYPSRSAMDNLCKLLPGLTMDYIYRGRFTAVPARLAIQLAARECHQNIDDVGAEIERFVAMVSARS